MSPRFVGRETGNELRCREHFRGNLRSPTPDSSGHRVHWLQRECSMSRSSVKSIIEHQRSRWHSGLHQLLALAVAFVGLAFFQLSAIIFCHSIAEANIRLFRQFELCFFVAVCILLWADRLSPVTRRQDSFSSDYRPIAYAAVFTLSILMSAACLTRYLFGGGGWYTTAGYVAPLCAVIAISIHSWNWRRANQIARDAHALQLFDSPSSGSYSLYLRPFVCRDRLPIEPEVAPANNPITQLVCHQITELMKCFSISASADLETILAKTLDGNAPLIAVGRPGEHFGAGRIQLSDADWQPGVVRLAQRATKIFLIPGEGVGTQWEMNLVLGPEFRAKTVWVMPRVLSKHHWLDLMGELSLSVLRFRVLYFIYESGVRWSALPFDRDLGRAGSSVVGLCVLACFLCMIIQVVKHLYRIRLCVKYIKAWSLIRQQFLKTDVLLPEFDRRGGCFLMGIDKRWMCWNSFPRHPSPFFAFLRRSTGWDLEAGFSRLDIARAVIKTLR